MRKQFFAQNHSRSRIDLPVQLAGMGSGDLLPNGSYKVLLGTYQTTVTVSLSTLFTLPGNRFTPGQIVSGSIVTPSGVTVATIPATELMPTPQTTIIKYKPTAFNPSITPASVTITMTTPAPPVSLSFDVEQWKIAYYPLFVRLENSLGQEFAVGKMYPNQKIYIVSTHLPEQTTTYAVTLLLYSAAGQVVEKSLDVTIEGGGEIPVDPPIGRP